MKIFCNRWRQLMLTDLDEPLDAAGRIRLEAHLQSCPACREQHRQLAAARAATAPLRRQRAEMPVPQGLNAAIRSQITASAANRQPVAQSSAIDLPGQPAPHRSASGRSRPLQAATALATVFLVIALIIVYRSIGQSMQTARLTSTANSSTAASARTEALDQARQYEISGGAAVAAGDASAKSSPANGSGLDKSASASGGTSGAVSVPAGNAAPGYRLYTGSLTDLGTLIAQVPNFSLSPQLLADASVLRILVSPADSTLPVRQAVILAGYPAAEAARLAGQFRSAIPANSSQISVETIPPESQSRLAALFGDALYAQLLPNATDRQLTYIMITIGG